jgi:hypothetical protein
MDDPTQQFIAALDKILTELEALHSDLATGLHNLKDAIDVNSKLHEECSAASRSIAVTDLRTDAPVRVETKAHRSKTEGVWRVIKGALESVGIVAVILYTVFAYNQWQEMMTANDVAMSNFRRSRIDANGQLKGLQAQINIAREQLDETRRQARVENGAFFTANEEIDKHMIVGKPFTGAATVVNVGKSEAREVRADVVLTRIKNGGKIVFSYDLSHTIMLGKIENPNESSKLETTWGKMVGPRIGAPILPTQKDVDDFTQGTDFFILYGRVTYQDVFGVRHWLHFCGFSTGTQGRFHARACTDYNDTDHN